MEARKQQFTSFAEYLRNEENYKKLLTHISQHYNDVRASQATGPVSRLFNELPLAEESRAKHFADILTSDDFFESQHPQKFDSLATYAIAIGLHDLFDENGDIKSDIAAILNYNNTLNELIKKYGENSVKAQLLSGYLTNVIGRTGVGRIFSQQSNEKLNGLFASLVNALTIDISLVDKAYIDEIDAKLKSIARDETLPGSLRDGAPQFNEDQSLEAGTSEAVSAVRVFTPDSWHLNDATETNNPTIATLRQNNWKYKKLKADSFPSILVPDVRRGGVLVNGQRFPGKSDASDEEVMEFIKRVGLLSDSEFDQLNNAWEDQTIFTDFQNALTTALAPEREELRFQPTAKIVTINLQHKVGGQSAVETIITGLNIVDTSELQTFAMPGSISSQVTLAGNEFVFKSVEFSNSILEMLSLKKEVDINSSERIKSAVAQAKDEEINAFRALLANMGGVPREDLRQPAEELLSLLSEASEEAPADLYDALTLTRQLIASPYNEAVLISLKKLRATQGDNLLAEKLAPLIDISEKRLLERELSHLRSLMGGWESEYPFTTLTRNIVETIADNLATLDLEKQSQLRIFLQNLYRFADQPQNESYKKILQDLLNTIPEEIKIADQVQQMMSDETLLSTLRVKLLDVAETKLYQYHLLKNPIKEILEEIPENLSELEEEEVAKLIKLLSALINLANDFGNDKKYEDLAQIAQTLETLNIEKQINDILSLTTRFELLKQQLNKTINSFSADEKYFRLKNSSENVLKHIEKEALAIKHSPTKQNERLPTLIALLKSTTSLVESTKVFIDQNVASPDASALNKEIRGYKKQTEALRKRSWGKAIAGAMTILVSTIITAIPFVAIVGTFGMFGGGYLLYQGIQKKRPQAIDRLKKTAKSEIKKKK